MAHTASILNSLVSVTQFNKGQASKIFDRLRTEQRLIVLKNNAPYAVILSPEEYDRLVEIEEDYRLLVQAQKRLKNSPAENAVSFNDTLTHFGISATELDETEAPDIE